VLGSFDIAGDMDAIWAHNFDIMSISRNFGTRLGLVMV